MGRAIIAAAAIVLCVLTQPLQADRRDRCTNVDGTLVFHATSPDSFESVLSGDLQGILVGTNFRIVKVGDDGTLFGVVDHAFVSTRGTFYTFAEVVLSPIGANLYRTSERNFFLGGTGDFTGANGTLLIQAFADFTIGAGSGHYHGRLCAGAFS
ncbi:MAG TPA: hypothetical protein VN654_31100 [Vicinamibacterales bacterium]|jgi:hypothetical protein|nr:hypothetical protein [Vicinamibacterales bacterium]